MSTRQASSRRIAIRFGCVAATLIGAMFALWLFPPAALPSVPLLVLVLTVVALASGTLGASGPSGRSAGRSAIDGRPPRRAREDRTPGGLFEDEEPSPLDSSTPIDGDLSPAPSSSGATVHQVLPAGPDWWNRATVARMAPPSSPSASTRLGADARPSSSARGDVATSAVSDPSTYLADAVIAQCPHCGSLVLDVDVIEVGYAFRCRSCLTPWTWRPGTPWPAVHLRPGARPASPPDHAALPEGH